MDKEVVNCVVCKPELEVGQSWTVLCPEHTNQMLRETAYNINEFEAWIQRAREQEKSSG